MPLCDTCSELDFAAISRRSVSKLFRSETGRNLFYYVARDANLRGPEEVLTPYHKTLESLHISAKVCELCRLVQNSTDIFSRDMRSGYEFWIGGRDSADGFQVLGFNKENVTERLVFDLIGGFGLCVDKR